MHRLCRSIPDFADAWNNLAQVQWEQGALPDAAVSVERAVALGGPRLADYRALQQTIAVSQNNAQKGLKPPQDVRSGRYDACTHHFTL
jgi:hypothetical protein